MGCALCLLTATAIPRTGPVWARGFCPSSRRPRGTFLLCGFFAAVSQPLLAACFFALRFATVCHQTYRFSIQGYLILSLYRFASWFVGRSILFILGIDGRSILFILGIDGRSIFFAQSLSLLSPAWHLMCGGCSARDCRAGDVDTDATRNAGIRDCNFATACLLGALFAIVPVFPVTVHE